MKINRYKYLAVLIAVWMLGLSACKKPVINSQPAPGEIGTLSAYLANNFDLSLFAAAVQKAGLIDSLNDPTTAFSIWAPLNTALNHEGIYSPADFDKWGADSLKYFVRTHIIMGKLFYQDIPPSSDNRYKNLNGRDLYVSKKGFNIPLIVNGAPVTSAQLASGTPTTFGTTQLNGVIYPITNVIKCFKGTVQDFLNSRPDLSVLVAGMKKFDLWDRLGGDGPYTVVAPQDTAFARYNLTQSTVAAINTSQYDPVLFGAYFVSPYHIYVGDLVQYIAGSLYYPYNTSVSDYKLIMNCGTNRGNNLSVLLAKGKVTTIAAEKLLGPVDPKHNNFPWGSVFLGENLPEGTSLDLNHPTNGQYIDFTCTNGIVHLLSQVLVMPSEVKIN